jgi:WD40 repeat protein
MLRRDDRGTVKAWDEESGVLHRELEGFWVNGVTALAHGDGQQAWVVAGSSRGCVRVNDPEAGSGLHSIDGHEGFVTDLACIASSSAAPPHPRLVSAAFCGTVRVWDGKTGEMLADLRGHVRGMVIVAVWKEHLGGHDRIATHDNAGVRVWDGEAFTLLHLLPCGAPIERLLPFESAEGGYHLLIPSEGLQVWDPEEGRRLHDGIHRGCPPLSRFHLFESARGRYLLAVGSYGARHPRHPGDAERSFLDVWDLGEAPARAGYGLRPANHLG